MTIAQTWDKSFFFFFFFPHVKLEVMMRRKVVGQGLRHYCVHDSFKVFFFLFHFVVVLHELVISFIPHLPRNY